MKQFMNIVLPMAGNGSRFKENGYTDSKPFIDVLGSPMVKQVIDNLQIEFNTKFHFIIICLKSDYVKYDIEKYFKKTYPKSDIKIIVLDKVTRGAAETVLTAAEFIDNDNPLLTLNSDQMIDYNVDKCYSELNQYDAGMLCFRGNGPKWSYAELDDNKNVIKVAEKVQISDIATAGYYFWKKGSDFVKYANKMILSNDTTNNEFYIAPVYNYAIQDNKKVGISMIDRIYQLGTPEDLSDSLKKLHG